jgi:hypothetical protein
MTSIAFRMTRHGLALLAALTCAVPVLAENSPELVPVTRNRLCVTEGAMQTLPDGKLSISVAKTRAVLATSGSQAIETRFTYLGPTVEMAPLRSGEIRQQFGLKLRAADGCNLVYAMWRFAPKSSLIVSVKSNPGLHTSRACGNSGYRNVSPRSVMPVEAPQPGATHRLAARLDGTALHVFVDGNLVWDGELGPDALGLDGPVGIRSDNARLELSVAAPAQTEQQHACPTPGGAEEE